jgi:hypothetical protein
MRVVNRSTRTGKRVTGSRCRNAKRESLSKIGEGKMRPVNRSKGCPDDRKQLGKYRA